MKKILITGAAGFIGSHLCERLLTQGNRVSCVDNLVTGNKNNIRHLVSNPQFKFIKADCSQPLKHLEPQEIIFHFASPASPLYYQKYPVETLAVNSIGTYHLLELAKNWQAKFIFASTSEVYGDPQEHPQTETYWGHVNPIGPRSCYDEAKRVGETWVMVYHRKYQLDTRILRIFNTYGPRMALDDGRVVTNFIKQILTNASLTINGDGKQTRSFCYIADLIEGIMAVANSSAGGEVFNLGNPEEITILQLAKILTELTGYPGKLIYQNLPQDDPERRQPDITKMTRLTGWQPKISLKTGLEKTYTYFKNQHAE